MKEELDTDLRIKDLELMTGVGRSAIHHYMRKGLLSPPRRTGKTMAYYGTTHVKELRRIRRLRAEGYPISIIKKKLKAAGSQGAPAEVDARPNRRDEIMEAAVKVFAEKGYHRAKIADITAAVGVGHSTFYLYFTSKKELLLECVDKALQSMFSDVIEEIRHEKDPVKRLRKRGEVAIIRHPEFLDILSVLRSTVDDDPRLENKRRELYAYIAKHVKSDIEEAMRRGLVPKVDAEMLAYSMVLGLLESAALLFSSGEGFSPQRLLGAMEAFYNRSPG
jgi:AcrR family transcriptional regulator